MIKLKWKICKFKKRERKFKGNQYTVKKQCVSMQSKLLNLIPSTSASLPKKDLLLSCQVMLFLSF